MFDPYVNTVSSENELIYIDKIIKINKLSRDMKPASLFAETTVSNRLPWCVHWSLLTGDLLVGMSDLFGETGKVIRFDQTRQIIQTIQYDDTRLDLYKCPLYITENNNGDIAVSDEGAVVVTDCGGKHRFSYISSQSGSLFEPRGICIYALSHILVCDIITGTVHRISQDGQFLSYLLIGFDRIGEPLGLSYDVNTHHVWVGSKNKKVFIYKYIERENTRKGNSD